MKQIHRHLMLATALATGLAVAAPLAAQAQEKAQDKSTVTTNPGFKPGSGQINPGETLAAPSSSTDIRKIPSHADAVAALMATDDPVSALGPEVPNTALATNTQAPSNTQAAAPNAKPENKTVSAPGAAGGDVTTATQGQAAIGGPMSPGASAGGGSNGPAAAEAPPTAKTETTGVGNRAADPHRPGPIGATGQTLPAKFSERNDVLDRLPIMAWPQRLTAEERQQIFKAVMADKAQPVADADSLQPASQLSTDQAMTGMHALPDSVKGIGSLKKLSFVKAKNKVLLVEPSTRIVVDEIAS
jgi:hypothetical protein